MSEKMRAFLVELAGLCKKHNVSMDGGHEDEELGMTATLWPPDPGPFDNVEAFGFSHVSHRAGVFYSETTEHRLEAPGGEV